MKTVLGLIVTEGYKSYIENLEKQLKGDFEIVYLVSTSNEQIKEDFQGYYHQVDAFVFSGHILKDYIKQEIKESRKPVFTINDDLANIYKELLKIFMNTPELDPGRVYIDFETSDYSLTLEEIFPEGHVPYVIPFDSGSPDEIVANILQNHLKFWEEDKVDLSITKFGMVLDHLDEANIKYHYIFPSEKYITNFLQTIINDIAEERIQKNNIFSINIMTDHLVDKKLGDLDLQIERIKLKSNIIKFIETTHSDAIFQEKNSSIELITTLEDIEKFISEDYQCYLQTFLDDEYSSMKIYIGYGSGKSLAESQHNSDKALKLSLQHPVSNSILISENQKIIGPFGRSQADIVTIVEHPTIEALAGHYQMDKYRFYNMVSFLSKINSNKITSKQVAEALNVSERTANRFLTQLTNIKLAQKNSVQNVSGKGRPSIIYEIVFVEVDGKVKELDTIKLIK